MGELVRTADKEKTFPKIDTTNWSDKMHIITEININAVPNYHIVNLPERYDEAILEETELKRKKNDKIPKRLQLNSVKLSLTIHPTLYFIFLNIKA